MFPLKDDNPISRTPYVTYALIAINVLVMVAISTLAPLERQVAMVEHGFVPARIAQLGNPNLVLRVPIAEPPVINHGMIVQQQPAAVVELDPVRSQVFASVVSTMFMHGGWLHLLGNMWFLWIFGDNVEDRLGSLLYLGFYLVGGLLATACHWAYDPSSIMPVVGASGAVATVLGAYAVAFPKSEVKTLVFLFFIITVINIPALIWLGLWFAGQLVSAFMAKDLTVAVWAHIGGFAAGAILMPILSFGSPPPGSTWEDELRKHFSFQTPER